MKKKICPSCSGTGRIEIYRPPFLRPCRNCGGTGKVLDKRVDAVKKPQHTEAQVVKNG
jgi:DnaJ-class molecular chaperone